MKQAIKALNIAVKLLWGIVLVFTVTSAYSLANFKISFGEPKTSISEGSVSLITPLFINNTGFYEITNLNITTTVKTHQNYTLSKSTTTILRIAPNQFIQKAHNITLDFRNPDTELQSLAFNDSLLDLNAIVGLKFANVIPVLLTINATMQWGAPLNNVSIGEITLDPIAEKLIIPLYFENHAFFDVNGIMRLEAYNDHSEQIGNTDLIVVVPSGHNLEDLIEIVLDPAKFTSEGQIRVFFNSSLFSAGPILKDWEI
jgi:hypothetical protein